MKNERQTKILEIIQQRDIETQEQLLAALAESGITVTQATISRDIRQLRLVKRMGANGVTRYAINSSAESVAHAGKLQTIFRECVVNCNCAQNIVVIKTLPGLASAAGSAIDNLRNPGVVGTLSGDDTVFVAMADVAVAEDFCAQIRKFLA